MSRVEEVYNLCKKRLPGHGPDKSMKTHLLELAETLDGHEKLDSYGSGEFLNDFEDEIARVFGKEAGVFMPSGIMVQQAALRVWCERNRNFSVAMHPTAHLEHAEHAAYQFLHGLKRLQFGQSEFLRERMLTVEDFNNLGSRPGAILLELPYRPLGGQLPDWETLEAIHGWAKDRDIPLHLDGARIWTCRPFYGKKYHEIAALFDSVYVSFYKDLGGLTGAMLVGAADFIQEAKIWQTRHGGRLKTLSPYAASARAGYVRVTPVIHEFVSAARQAAEILSGFDEITIRPNPPHANIFQIYIRGEAEALNERHLQLAEETGTFLFWRLGESPVPGVAMTEIHCWEEAVRFDFSALVPFVERLLDT